MVTKVALLTAGGFAPCLSSAVGGLIERYTEIAPDVEIIAYKYGYQGLLSGDFITVTPEIREGAALLHSFGGSPIGNSRVKLTNAADLVKRGLVAEGVDPLQAAADRLDSCIGCGCLSLARCSLSNPDDVLSRQGPGAYYLEPQHD